MVKEKQDITGLNYIKGALGKVIVDCDFELMDQRLVEGVHGETEENEENGVKEGPGDCIRIAEVTAILKKDEKA